MEKIIVRVALFRWGLSRFEAEVNAACKSGWKLVECTVTQPRVRTLCFARLYQVQDKPCCAPAKDCNTASNAEARWTITTTMPPAKPAKRKAK